MRMRSRESSSNRRQFNRLTYILSTEGIDIDTRFNMSLKKLEHVIIEGLRQCCYEIDEGLEYKRYLLNHRHRHEMDSILTYRDDVMSEILWMLPTICRIEEVCCPNHFTVRIAVRIPDDQTRKKTISFE